MTLCEFVDIFVEVENHSYHDDDGNKKQVGADKLVDDVAVEPANERSASVVGIFSSTPFFIVCGAMGKYRYSRIFNRRFFSIVRMARIIVYASVFPPLCVSKGRNCWLEFACALRVRAISRMPSCGWRQSA